MKDEQDTCDLDGASVDDAEKKLIATGRRMCEGSAEITLPHLSRHALSGNPASLRIAPWLQDNSSRALQAI